MTTFIKNNKKASFKAYNLEAGTKEGAFRDYLFNPNNLKMFHGLISASLLCLNPIT